MVTYEIRNESTEKSDEPHLKLYLKNDCGKIRIMCDEERDYPGDGWHIGEFLANGSLKLNARVGVSTGLNLDNAGRIKVELEKIGGE